MIHGVAERLSSVFVRNGTITEDEQDLYSYGLELLISNIVGVAAALAIGIILGNLIGAVIFLLAFIPVRTYAGGLHAKNNFFCIMSMSVNMLLAFAIYLFLQKYIGIVSLCLMIPAAVATYIIAPSESENKPLTEREKSRNKKLSTTIFSIESIIGLILLLISTFTNADLSDSYSFVFLGMYSAFISMAVSHIFEKRRKNHEEQCY
ncbi:MAG: accessory gene regulator B family protein [Oscillospiraceae bacterium]|jgi:accessory gene regulator B|nr:accessory gene regulator B family protein [Oscillospiraceae bacterium]